MFPVVTAIIVLLGHTAGLGSPLPHEHPNCIIQQPQPIDQVRHLHLLAALSPMCMHSPEACVACINPFLNMSFVWQASGQ